MRLWSPEELPKLPELKLAVVGHVEWVTFLKVDNLPKAGTICHAESFFEEPAGGGAVAAVKLSEITGMPVHFITSLGKDLIGKQSANRLEELGLKLSITWRDKPTRRGLSLVNDNGDRAITVIGERLQPCAKDELPWKELGSYQGVFVTAADSNALKSCRCSELLVTTPRLSISTIQQSKVKIDVLVGSGLDPDERYIGEKLSPPPRIRIETEGEMGGQAWPGGRFKAFNLKKQVVDTYGCGDSFAAGVTAGLAAGWSLEKAISLGSDYGAKCATHFGPYENTNFSSQ